MTKKALLPNIAVLIICIAAAAFAVTPFLFMLISSFKPGQELLRHGINLNIDTTVMSLNNYKLLFTENNGLYF